MTRTSASDSADAAFRPDPAAGAIYARDRIRTAAQTVAAEAAKPQADRSAAAIGAALANAERWYHALCRHDLAAPDDHSQMDEMRTAAARATPAPAQTQADEQGSNDLLKLGAAAMGGFIVGDLLDIFD